MILQQGQSKELDIVVKDTAGNVVSLFTTTKVVAYLMFKEQVVYKYTNVLGAPDGYGELVVVLDTSGRVLIEVKDTQSKNFKEGQFNIVVGVWDLSGKTEYNIAEPLTVSKTFVIKSE